MSCTRLWTLFIWMFISAVKFGVDGDLLSFNTSNLWSVKEAQFLLLPVWLQPGTGNVGIWVKQGRLKIWTLRPTFTLSWTEQDTGTSVCFFIPSWPAAPVTCLLHSWFYIQTCSESCRTFWPAAVPYGTTHTNIRPASESAEAETLFLPDDQPEGVSSVTDRPTQSSQQVFLQHVEDLMTTIIP